MTVDVQVVPARPIHIRRIARHMRQQDRDEAEAMSGKSPGKALAYSLRKSSAAWTVMVDGKPAAMFGVGDLNVLAGIGSPWMLGTDDIVRARWKFLAGCREWRQQLLSRYPVLRNMVDDRNTVAKRWLSWMGFEFIQPVDVNGHRFWLFEMRA